MTLSLPLEPHKLPAARWHSYVCGLLILFHTRFPWMIDTSFIVCDLYYVADNHTSTVVAYCSFELDFGLSP